MRFQKLFKKIVRLNCAFLLSLGLCNFGVGPNNFVTEVHASTVNITGDQLFEVADEALAYMQTHSSSPYSYWGSCTGGLANMLHAVDQVYGTQFANKIAYNTIADNNYTSIHGVQVGLAGGGFYSKYATYQIRQNLDAMVASGEAILVDTCWSEEELNRSETKNGDLFVMDIVSASLGSTTGHVGIIKRQGGTVYTGNVSSSGAYNLPSGFISQDPPKCKWPMWVYRVTTDQKDFTVNVVKKSSLQDVTDSNQQYTLLGAVYGVYTDKDCKNEVGSITTDQDGKGSFTDKFDADTESLYVKEKTAPAGYDLDEQVYQAEFDGTTTSTVTSLEKPNTNLFTIQVHKKANDISGSQIPSLEGAQYTIHYYDQQYADLNQIGTEPKRTWVIQTKNDHGEAIARIGEEWKVGGDAFYYNADGQIVIPLGTITIQETKAPDGYSLDGSSYITTDDANNESIHGNGIVLFHIVKRDNDIVLMSDNEIVQNEKSLRGGFEVQKYDQDFGKQVSGDSENLITGISIKNTNPYDVKMFGQDDAVVATAKANAFFLQEDGSRYQFYTNEEGYLITNHSTLPTGTYELYEETPPKGYTKKEEAFGIVTVQQEGIITKFTEGQLTNQQVYGGFEIQKEDSLCGVDAQGDTNLQTTFELFNRSVHAIEVDGVTYGQNERIDTITTNSDGYFTSTEDYLPYGSYELIETVPPVGYTGSDTVTNSTRSLFSIREEKTIITCNSFVNEVITGKFSIHKTYANKYASGFTQNEKGATFIALLKSKVRDINQDGKISGAEVRQQYQDLSAFQPYEQTKIVTDENGKATSSPLAYGTYVIVQLASPSEEIALIEDPVEFKVTKQNQETITYEATNLDQPYWLQIQKKDVQTGELVTYNSAEFKLFQLTDSIGNEVNQYVRQNVNAKYYDVFRTVSLNHTQDPISSSTFLPVLSDEEMEQMRGETIVPLSLYAGTYRLEEVKAPQGFTLMEPITFEVHHGSIHDQDEDGQPIVQVIAQDQQVTGSFALQKTIEEYEADTTFINRDDLSDISFALRANEDIVNPDNGQILTHKGDLANDIYGNCVGEFSLDSLGQYSCDQLPLGSYCLKEVSVPNGMILNEEEIMIQFEQQDTIQEVYEVAKEIQNKTTKVSLSKKAVTGEDELVGATLSVYDTNHNCIDTWVSQDHPHTIEGLTVGQQYELVEEIAVEDYVKASSIVFVIANDGEVQSVTMIDQQVSFVKEDTQGNPLSGAVITIEDKEGNVVDHFETTDQEQFINHLIASETYTAKETYVPSGYYFAEDQTFTVKDNNANQEIKMVDQKIRYQIEKVDDTGKPVAGVTLKLFDVTNQDTEIELPNEGITTKEPFVLEGVLNANHQYRLVEEEYVAGVYQATDILFTVPSHGTKDLVTITMQDATTNVSVVKVDGQQRILEGAHLQVVEAEKDGNEIVAKKNENGEDIVVKDFITTYQNTDISDCVKGDEWYLLQEVESPYGYDVAEPIPFLVSGKQNQAQVIQMCDDAKPYQVNVHKISFETKEALSGAEFILLDGNGNVAKDCNGNECIGVTNDEGNLVWNLSYTQDASKYYVKETAAPVGYTCCEDPFFLEFDTEKEFITEPIEITIEDTLEPTTGVSMPQMGWIVFISVIGFMNFLYLGIRK